VYADESAWLWSLLQGQSHQTELQGDQWQAELKQSLSAMPEHFVNYSVSCLVSSRHSERAATLHCDVHISTSERISGVAENVPTQLVHILYAL
jgi:hypothetical protein